MKVWKSYTLSLLFISVISILLDFYNFKQISFTYVIYFFIVTLLPVYILCLFIILALEFINLKLINGRNKLINLIFNIIIYFIIIFIIELIIKGEISSIYVGFKNLILLIFIIVYSIIRELKYYRFIIKKITR